MLRSNGVDRETETLKDNQKMSTDHDGNENAEMIVAGI